MGWVSWFIPFCSTEEDQVRIVRIAPSDKWGGGGVLGAEVGHGVLHRLPSACRETVGTSIGFVSLSEEAKAATDPYCELTVLDSRAMETRHLTFMRLCVSSASRA
jgi:hypothetical protein